MDRVRNDVVVLRGGQELLEEERVARRRVEDRLPSLEIERVRRRQAVEQVACALRRKDVEQDRCAAHAAAPVRTTVQELGPGEDDQEDRPLCERRDVLDEVEQHRRRVVDVLDDENDRPLAGERLEQAADRPGRLLDGPGGRRLARGGGDSHGDGVAVGRAGKNRRRPRPDASLGERRKRIAKRRVRRVFPEGRPADRTDRGPGEDVDELAREPRLPDAGRAQDGHESRMPIRRRELEGAEQLAELVGATHERCLEPPYDCLGIREHALDRPRACSAHDGVTDEPPGAFSDLHVSLRRAREEPVGLLERRAGNERPAASRIAGDHRPGRDRGPPEQVRLAEVARSARRAERIVLMRRRHAEDPEQAVVARLTKGAAVRLDRRGGARACPTELFAARFGILRSDVELGDEKRHGLACLLDRVGAPAFRDESRRVERRIVAQDRPLELVQLGREVQAELVVERGARGGERVERVGLPAGAVEREHELRTESLAKRLFADERLELGHELRVTALREVGLDPQLERLEPQLVETGGRQGDGLAREIGERWAAPERKRLAKQRSYLLGAALRDSSTRRRKRSRSSSSGSTRSR